MCMCVCVISFHWHRVVVERECIEISCLVSFFLSYNPEEFGAGGTEKIKSKRQTARVEAWQLSVGGLDVVRRTAKPLPK